MFLLSLQERIDAQCSCMNLGVGTHLASEPSTEASKLAVVFEIRLAHCLWGPHEYLQSRRQTSVSGLDEQLKHHLKADNEVETTKTTVFVIETVDSIQDISQTTCNPDKETNAKQHRQRNAKEGIFKRVWARLVQVFVVPESAPISSGTILHVHLLSCLSTIHYLQPVAKFN